MADTTMACATTDRCQSTQSSQRINLATLMQLMEGGVVAEVVPINKNLGKHLQPTALPAGLKCAVGFDGDEAMRNRVPFEKLACAMAPGTPLENGQLDPSVAGCW